MRPSARTFNELRAVALETDFSKYAEGSCLAKFGDTHVMCTASVEDWYRRSCEIAGGAG